MRRPSWLSVAGYSAGELPRTLPLEDRIRRASEQVSDCETKRQRFGDEFALGTDQARLRIVAQIGLRLPADQDIARRWPNEPVFGNACVCAALDTHIMFRIRRRK